MDLSVNKVILLFKTHLDVGFTDYVSAVIDDYIHNYIPTAIRLANSLKTSRREERFVWTVGSWMIARYLETAQGDERAAMERALREGDISYHALPFTMHTEAMDAGLFRYGLSIAKRLDQQFGRKTIAGKYTDVPGHTKAMIPLLSESGIQLVHIGVNPASAPPDVPDFFVWRFDHDNEVTVVYN
ncbi:MAG TPA: glycoside hydrolase, partial [Candidatus Aphodoplasma excrementigallinarum]|nr:glycoside hydrolase [Candidatus Aphodoplasma excrementigallinarum]